MLQLEAQQIESTNIALQGGWHRSTFPDRDPEVFIETYGMVRSQAGIVPVTLLPWQREYLHGYTDRDIHEKSRDIRCSTTLVHLMMTIAVWNGGDVILAGNREETAVNLLDIARVFLAGLPREEFHLELETDNFTRIETNYGFKVHAISRPMSARFSTAGRSERCKQLLISEYSTAPWDQEYWAALSGSVVADGRISIESTHNGVGCNFHRMLQDAKAGKNGFKPWRFDWRVNPEHDAAWEVQKRRENSPRKFAEEYECEPSVSGRCFFEASSLVLHPYERNWACKRPIPACLTAMRDLCRESELEIYALPQEGHTYTGGYDCATGTGADFDDGSIIDDESAEEVAALRGQWKCDVFGQKIDALARFYQGRHAIERPGPGEAVIQECRRLGTPGLWRSRHDGEFGWPTAATGPHARRPMLDMLERDVRLQEIKFGSQRFIDEARVFQFGNDDQPRAASGYNDDAVMSRAIANKVRKSARPGIA